MARKRERLSMNVAWCKYSVVRSAARERGIRVITDKEDRAFTHDIWWQDVAVSTDKLIGMHAWQRINHWPGMAVLHRKDGLAKTLRRMTRVFSAEYDFFPNTWILPDDWADFVHQFPASSGGGGAALPGPRVSKHTFIVKPAASCQGRGIFLTRNLADIEPRSAQIAQRYIARPFLVDGLKFDLRIYVLITSVDPLRVWLYDEGLARFATTPYNVPSGRNMEQMQMHLTNYAINKDSPNFVFNAGGVDAGDSGSKRTISWFRKWLDEHGFSGRLVWGGIAHMINKMCIAAVPHLRRTYRSVIPGEGGAHSMRAFEVLGLDVLLDHKLRPWLLEVNHSPSFTCDTPLDWEIKVGVIGEAIDLLRLRVKERKRLQTKEAEASRVRLYGAGVSDPHAAPAPSWLIPGVVKSAVATMLGDSTARGRAGRRSASTSGRFTRGDSTSDGSSTGAGASGTPVSARTPLTNTPQGSIDAGSTAEEDDAPLSGDHRGIPYVHQRHEIKVARGYRMIYPLADPGDVDDSLFASNASATEAQTAALDVLARSVGGKVTARGESKLDDALLEGAAATPPTPTPVPEPLAAPSPSRATPSVVSTGAVSLRPTSAVELKHRSRMLEQQLSKNLGASPHSAAMRSSPRKLKVDGSDSGDDDRDSAGDVDEAEEKLADDELGIIEDDDAASLGGAEPEVVTAPTLSARRDKRIVGPLDHGAPLPFLPPCDVSREAMYARQREYLYFAAVADELYALEMQAAAGGSRKAGENAVNATAAIIAAAVKTVAGATAATGGASPMAARPSSGLRGRGAPPASSAASDVTSISRMLHALAEAGRAKAAAAAGKSAIAAPPSPRKAAGIRHSDGSRPADSAHARPPMRARTVGPGALRRAMSRSPSFASDTSTADEAAAPRASTSTVAASSASGITVSTGSSAQERLSLGRPMAASPARARATGTTSRVDVAPLPPAPSHMLIREAGTPAPAPLTDGPVRGIALNISSSTDARGGGVSGPRPIITTSQQLPTVEASSQPLSSPMNAPSSPMRSRGPDVMGAVSPMLSPSRTIVVSWGSSGSTAVASVLPSPASPNRAPHSQRRMLEDSNSDLPQSVPALPSFVAQKLPASRTTSPRRSPTRSGARSGMVAVPRIVRIGNQAYAATASSVAGARGMAADTGLGSAGAFTARLLAIGEPTLAPSASLSALVPGVHVDPILGARTVLHAHADAPVQGATGSSARARARGSSDPPLPRRPSWSDRLFSAALAAQQREASEMSPPRRVARAARTPAADNVHAPPIPLKPSTAAATSSVSVSLAASSTKRPPRPVSASTRTVPVAIETPAPLIGASASNFSATKSFSAAMRAYSARSRMSDSTDRLVSQEAEDDFDRAPSPFHISMATDHSLASLLGGIGSSGGGKLAGMPRLARPASAALPSAQRQVAVTAAASTAKDTDYTLARPAPRTRPMSASVTTTRM